MANNGDSNDASKSKNTIYFKCLVLEFWIFFNFYSW